MPNIKVNLITIAGILILASGVIYAVSSGHHKTATEVKQEQSGAEEAKVLGVSTQDKQPSISVKKISAADAKKLIDDNKDNSQFKIIDIRTPEEYAAGNIDGSVNIDFYGSDFLQEISKLDKDETHLVYCNTGGRSAQSMQVFEQLGFKDTYNLEGGYNAWVSQ